LGRFNLVQGEEGKSRANEKRRSPVKGNIISKKMGEPGLKSQKLSWEAKTTIGKKAFTRSGAGTSGARTKGGQ